MAVLMAWSDVVIKAMEKTIIKSYRERIWVYWIYWMRLKIFWKTALLFLFGKALIDREELLEIIKEIRIQLPDEVKQAQWIKEERQRILVEAQKEARYDDRGYKNTY